MQQEQPAATPSNGNSPRVDVAIIGGGPVGLAAAIEAGRRGLTATVFERGTLVQTIVDWPAQTTFFSDARNIELGGYPMVCNGIKPSRRDAIQYYQRVARAEGLDVQTYTEVAAIEPIENGNAFRLRTRSLLPAAACTDGGAVARADVTVEARTVVLATGYFGSPTTLGVPGEELPHVHGRYTEPAPYWGRRVAIIGGSNSAIETALELYRADVDVSVIHRRGDIRDNVKYWLAPDFRNRVRDGAIRFLANSEVTRIEPGVVWIRPSIADVDDPAAAFEEQAVPADFVIRLIGYHATDTLVRPLGVALTEDQDRPVLSDEFETSLPGLYAIGSAGFGRDTRSVFIENGREHATNAIRSIGSRLGIGRASGAELG